MDKLSSNKGFSIVETLIVMMVLALFTALTIRPFQNELTQSKDFQNQIIHTRFDALLLHQTLIVESQVFTEYPIRFNASGNINMGQTVEFLRTKVILQIGTGRCYEKSLSDD